MRFAQIYLHKTSPKQMKITLSPCSLIFVSFLHSSLGYEFLVMNECNDKLQDVARAMDASKLLLDEVTSIELVEMDELRKRKLRGVDVPEEEKTGKLVRVHEPQAEEEQFSRTCPFHSLLECQMGGYTWKTCQFRCSHLRERRGRKAAELFTDKGGEWDLKIDAYDQQQIRRQVELATGCNAAENIVFL